MRDDHPRRIEKQRPAPEALYSPQSEAALLAALLTDNAEFFRLPDGFSAEHFYDSAHSRMFAQVSAKIGAGEEANAYSLAPLWDGMAVDEGEAARTGEAPLSWRQYVRRVSGAVGIVFTAAEYAREIMRLSEARDLWWAMEDAQHALLSEIPEGQPASRAAAPLLSRLMLSGEGPKKTAFTGAEAAEAGLKAADDAKTGRGLTRTGLADIDRLIGGFAPGRMTVVAGRPGMGKTALAVTMAAHAAAAGRGAIIISLEMTSAQMGQRLISAVGALLGLRIPYADLASGRYSPATQEAAEVALGAIMDMPITILDGLTSVGEIAAAAMKQKQAWAARGIPLGLVVVDYIQRVTPPKSRGDSRVNEVTDISNALKNMSLALGVNVMALSQLNRSVENREDKHPKISDLRDSGAIEQDADNILLLYRGAYYLEQIPLSERIPGDWDREHEAVKHLLEVQVAKNRHGPQGEVRLYCEIQHNHFENLARERDEGGFYGRY